MFGRLHHGRPGRNFRRPSRRTVRSGRVMSIGADSRASAELAAAHLLLERRGVTPEQLLTAARPPPAMPTFEEYFDRVSQAVTEGTRRVYGTYWAKVCEVWGSRRLDE